MEGSPRGYDRGNRGGAGARARPRGPWDLCPGTWGFPDCLHSCWDTHLCHQPLPDDPTGCREMCSPACIRGTAGPGMLRKWVWDAVAGTSPSAPPTQGDPERTTSLGLAWPRAALPVSGWGTSVTRRECPQERREPDGASREMAGRAPEVEPGPGEETLRCSHSSLLNALTESPLGKPLGLRPQRVP